MMTATRSKEREHGFCLPIEAPGSKGVSEVDLFVPRDKNHFHWERPLLIAEGRGQQGQIALRDSRMDCRKGLRRGAEGVEGNYPFPVPLWGQQRERGYVLAGVPSPVSFLNAGAPSAPCFWAENDNRGIDGDVPPFLFLRDVHTQHASHLTRFSIVLKLPWTHLTGSSLDQGAGVAFRVLCRNDTGSMHLEVGGVVQLQSGSV
jgi:hypothetical protein